MIRNPVRRRHARNAARAVAALSATMLATTAWMSTDSVIDAASAEVAAGAALVIVPDDGRPDGGSQLDSGVEDTEFTLRLPPGAGCPGDSKDGGYRVTSYVVPSTKDPATLVFDSEGPQPQQFGPPQSTFAQPLWDVFGSPYIVAQTADADPPGGQGPIINVAAFSFDVYEEVGTGYEIPAGEYNVGIACFVPAEGAPAPLQSFWNVEMSVTQSAETPSVMGWTVAQDVITQTVLTLDPAEGAKRGDPVRLTAVVTPADSAGTVTFFDAGVAMGDPVEVSEGVAEITRNDLAAGARDFTASFTPAADGFIGSTSDPVTYMVDADATTTTLTVSPADEAAVGATVTLTATVAPDVATGTVTFLDGTKSLGEDAVESGTATLEVTDLAAGQHTLTARFTPSDGTPHAESTSSDVAYTITEGTTVTLTVDPEKEATAGDEVELMAEVADGVSDVVDGEVEFKSGTVSLGRVELDDGSGLLTLDDLEVGDHVLTATFAPPADSDLKGATSPAVAYKVLPVSTTTTTTAPTTTTESTAPTSEPSMPPAPPDAAVGAGSLSTGSGTLPLTGGSLSLVFWAALVIVSGRIAVLLGRSPDVKVAGDSA